MNLQDNVSLDVNLKVTSELAQAVTPSTDMAWQWLEGCVTHMKVYLLR